MSSDKEEDNEKTGLEKARLELEKLRLHFTVLRPDDAQWPGLAKDLSCWDNDADFIISVDQPFHLPRDLNYVTERIDLHRPKPEWRRKNEKDQWEYIHLRTRIFRYDRRPTPSIVPSISPLHPSQPYAEIRWLGGSVSRIGIRGLENLVPRGGGVAKEAKLLADAADVFLSLSYESVSSYYKAQKAKSTNDKGNEHQQAPSSTEEQLWLAEACPAAKAIGKRNGKFIIEALAEEMKLSDGTIKARKKSFLDSWPQVEAAYLEGKQEYATEQMAKTDK